MAIPAYITSIILDLTVRVYMIFTAFKNIELLQNERFQEEHGAFSSAFSLRSSSLTSPLPLFHGIPLLPASSLPSLILATVLGSSTEEPTQSALVHTPCHTSSFNGKTYSTC